MSPIAAVLSVLGGLGLDAAAIAVSLLLAILARSWFMVAIQSVHLGVTAWRASRDRDSK